MTHNTNGNEEDEVVRALMNRERSEVLLKPTP